MPPVTSIQAISNTSNRGITFINTEYSGNNRDIGPDQTTNVSNCWIPWCTKSSDFPMHHLQIQDDNTDQVLWFVWQSGDSVRASKTGFDPNAGTIPGVAAAGHSLALMFLSDGSLRSNNY